MRTARWLWLAGLPGLLASSPALAQPALVQSAVGYNSTDAGSTFSLALPGPSSPGATLVVAVFWVQSAFSPQVTDSNQNDLRPIGVALNPWKGATKGSSLQLFEAREIDGGLDTVSVVMSAGYDDRIGIGALEYLGLADQAPESVSVELDGGATGALFAPALAASEGSMSIAAFVDTNGSGLIDAGAGWTGRLSDGRFYFLVEDQLAAVTGSLTPGAVSSASDADWVGVAASLPAARPDAGPPSPRRLTIGCAQLPRLEGAAWSAVLAALALRRRRGTIDHRR